MGGPLRLDSECAETVDRSRQHLRPSDLDGGGSAYKRSTGFIIPVSTSVIAWPFTQVDQTLLLRTWERVGLSGTDKSGYFAKPGIPIPI